MDCPNCKMELDSQFIDGVLHFCETCGHKLDITLPQFQPGDRFWTHYDYQWGTVERINHTRRGETHGVTGDPLPDTTWYDVVYDNGSHSMLDDAHGNWDMARMVPPAIAKRRGYGNDPKKENK